MDFSVIMKELEEYGSEQTKKTYISHECREPLFGVKAGDLNKLIKKYKLKNNHELALDLYDTGNYDAMYLAGLIVDANKMTKDDFYHWMEKANCHMLADYAVGAAASESPLAMELSKEFIATDEDLKQSCGYSIYSLYVALVSDEKLNKEEIFAMLDYIEKNILWCGNRTRYSMNGFVIAVGTSVPLLYDKAYDVAEKLGVVKVEMGNTACRVPIAKMYLDKVKNQNRLGFKRKSSRC